MPQSSGSPRGNRSDAHRKTCEDLLISGLDDWVHLYEIHSQVMRNKPDATLEEIQNATLETIRSLVTDGLFKIGDLSGPDGEFRSWNSPLNESISRIADVYMKQFEDESAWIWTFWLELTDTGRKVAEALYRGPHAAI